MHKKSFEEKVRYIYSKCTNMEDIYWLVKSVVDQNTKDNIAKVNGYFTSMSARTAFAELHNL